MSIADKLSKIKARSESLNSKTDQFNSTVGKIEEQLQEFGAGVEFWWKHELDLREQRIEDNGRIWTERSYFVLGYTKIGGAWRIAVQLRHDEPSGYADSWNSADEGDPIPLQRASRRVRAAAAAVLESFLEALEAELGDVEAAIDRANELVKDTPRGATTAHELGHELTAAARAILNLRPDDAIEWWKNFVDTKWPKLGERLKRLNWEIGHAIGVDGKVPGRTFGREEAEQIDLIAQRLTSLLDGDIGGKLPTLPTKKSSDQAVNLLSGIAKILSKIEDNDRDAVF